MKAMTTQELEELFREAFKAGELWGVTYSTWFVPSVEDTAEAMTRAMKEVLEKLNKKTHHVSAGRRCRT
jgi:hypothetical protein